MIAPLLGLVAIWGLVPLLGIGAGPELNDLPVYRGYAAQVLDGVAPYRDTGLEYPPLALVPILAGAVFGTDYAGYEWGFGAVTQVSAAGLLVATALLAREGRAAAAWTVAAGPLLTGALIRTHFDVVPAAILAAALLALARGRPGLGFAALGAGAMTKGYPALVVPVAFVWLAARGQVRAAVRGVGVFIVVVAAVSAPFLSSGYLDAYRFHLERPLQLESTPASLLLALGEGEVTGIPQRPNRWRSQAVEDAPAFVSAAFLALLLAALAFVVARAGARGDPRWLALCAYTAVLAYMALGKVLSPQFLIWLIPLVGLAWAWRERLLAGLLVGAMVLTQVEFPSRYRDLVAREDTAIALVAVRNVVLLAALTLLLARLAAPARSSPRAAAATPG